MWRQKLASRAFWIRHLQDRLAEPLHLNALALSVGLFGAFEARVDFDLVMRRNNAFCLLQAARFARRCGATSLRAVEFGVANGAGLMNMAAIAARVTRSTGVAIDVVGFDTGAGMPPPVDYRDHPDCYGIGDFPMQAPSELQRRLPAMPRCASGCSPRQFRPF